MGCRRRCALGVSLLALLLVSGVRSVCAQQQTLSPEQVQALLKRLQEAERRINELQRELEALKPKASAGGSSHSTAADTDVSGVVVPQPRLVPAAETSTDDVLQRLTTLEKRWAELNARDEDLATALKNTVAPGTTRNTMKVSGRIHADYWAFPGHDMGADILEGIDPQDRFVFRRLRFGVKGDIKDNMEYKIEMEFADPNDTEFRDAYLGFKNLGIFQTVLIGNQKRPYGLDHLNSSRYNVFLERPFIIEAFNEDSRRLGIASYGVSDDLRWNWRYGVYNLEKTQNDPGYLGDNYQLQFAGRLANTIWYDETSDGRGYAHWAISGTVAQPDGNATAGSTHSNEARFRTRPEARTSTRWLNTGRIAGADLYGLLGLESVVNVGPVQVVGELQNVWMNRNAAPSLHFWGGYVYVSYFLTGEHMPWNRKAGVLGRPTPFENFFLVDCCDGGTGAGWGAWQVAVRYSYADLNSEDILGGIGESITFGLNWYWNPNARMQFNYIHGSIDSRTAGLMNITGGDYDIIGTRFMVDF